MFKFLIVYIKKVYILFCEIQILGSINYTNEHKQINVVTEHIWMIVKISKYWLEHWNRCFCYPYLSMTKSRIIFVELIWELNKHTNNAGYNRSIYR